MHPKHEAPACTKHMLIAVADAMLPGGSFVAASSTGDKRPREQARAGCGAPRLCTDVYLTIHFTYTTHVTSAMTVSTGCTAAVITDRLLY